MTGPVTLFDLSRDGKLLWCWCAECERDVDPATRCRAVTTLADHRRARRHEVRGRHHTGRA